MQDRWITDRVPSKVFPAYTRGNAGEVLPDPVSPLAWSLVWQHGIVKGCRIQVGEDWRAGPEWRAKSFRVLLRSPADVEVLSLPPWWTLRRLLWAVAVLVAVAVRVAVVVLVAPAPAGEVAVEVAVAVGSGGRFTPALMGPLASPNPLWVNSLT